MRNSSENKSDTDLNRLIKGCLRGERASQKLLYDWLASSMMVLCLRYSKNQEEAEEILQDGFLQVFRFIDKYKRTGSFEGWVRKIMINCALMKYRGKSLLHQVISLTDEHDNFVAEDEFFDRMGEKELILLIQQLPHSYRMVFNLYVFEGLKHREIALLLDITEGTSKSNLSDARALLRKALTPPMKLAK
jgi:RNA polymerase sigma-70 factor, ECF subfamily